MVALDDDRTTIRITRGDMTGGYNNVLAFCCPYIDSDTGEEKLYKFKVNDLISFVVYEKKGYTKKELFRKNYTLKDLGYKSGTEVPEIPLTENDTRKFPLVNKPVTYWYDIILNNKNTIIGYDEDGAKKIIVYPEAEEE